MSKNILKKGDSVTWNTSQGTTNGKVEKKVITNTKIKKFTATADPEHPKYKVKSSNTGKVAIHKATSLRKTT